MRELIAEEEIAKAQTNQRGASRQLSTDGAVRPPQVAMTFLRLGHDLERAGMRPAEIDATLWQEAGNGRHPSERRAQIKYIMRSLRGSFCRLAA
jgi:hypothetical protein